MLSLYLVLAKNLMELILNPEYSLRFLISFLVFSQNPRSQFKTWQLPTMKLAVLQKSDVIEKNQ